MRFINFNKNSQIDTLCHMLLGKHVDGETASAQKSDTICIFDLLSSFPRYYDVDELRDKEAMMPTCWYILEVHETDFFELVGCRSRRAFDLADCHLCVMLVLRAVGLMGCWCPWKSGQLHECG